MTRSKIADREEWLTRMTEMLRPLFAEIGHPLPKKIRLTCGFPSRGGLGVKKRTVGECWYPEASDDQTVEVSVSPMEDNEDNVCDILAHELCHAAGGRKHGKKFKAIADAIGLLPPYPTTTASPELTVKLRKLHKQVGAYPHAKLTYTKNKKPDVCRLVKVVCPSPDCGYTIRTTRKWIEVGLPTCCCGEEMVLPEDKPED